MALIPAEALPYFENAIYLPMLVQVLEKDLDLIENGPFKLKRPYTHLIEETLKVIRAELKETNAFMRNRKLKIIKGASDGTFTEYAFFTEDMKKNENI